MKSIIKRILICAVAIFVVGAAITSQAFTVRRIQIRGLQNIESSTVRSHINVHPGQNFTAAESNKLLRSLYATGFFNRVDIGRHGSTLVVSVQERPMITLVKMVGNKEISDDKVKPVLTKLKIAAGNIYSPMSLTLFDKSLEQQYSMLGYAATSVTSQVKKVSHNRVAITIHVNEGKIVKVNSIHIIGNHAFKESTLRKQFKMTTPGIFTFFNHKDRYSPYKLDKDLQSLKDFYLNHGYLHYREVSHRVEFINHRKRVNIYVTVSEGTVYHLSGFRIEGRTLGFQDQVNKVVTLKKGQVFSRQKVMYNQKLVQGFFANKAYAFTSVSIVPTLDNANRTVFLTFKVTTGQRVYIRQIHFVGNTMTNQRVLRREMRQMEAAPYSLAKVKESKRRLMLTSYFASADYTTSPVPGTNNQMDLVYTVKERPAGKASIQGGYSSAYGFLYGASITQPNFLGSGKYVALGFTNSQVTQNYSFSYVNPYYTWYNVSRGFSVYYNRNKFSKSFGYMPYVMDTLGGDINYGFPLSENSSLAIDLGYSRVMLSHIAVNSGLAPSVLNFINPTPAEFSSNNVTRDYNSTAVTAGWTYNGFNRYIMPTKGVKNQLSVKFGAPIISNSLGYYTVTDAFSAYLPITHGFLLNFLANAGYGAGVGTRDGTAARLPFFYNFYGGGIGTVPGFDNNTLGPKYRQGTANAAASLGGNLLATAGVHLVLPSFFTDQVRLALTFDAGNVFQLPVYRPDVIAQAPNMNQSLIIQDDPFALRNMRMSAGLLVIWYAPFFGPIDLSLAFPLNSKPGDQIENFQFAMGLSF